MKIDIDQIDYLHPLLQEMITDLEETFRVEFLNTSNYRPGDSGVHGHGRGFDLACTYDPLGKVIEDYINTEWLYDPSRPTMKCCMYHDAGSGKHIHLQVHPATVKK